MDIVSDSMSDSYVQNGLRSVPVDDIVTCPDCGHDNSLLEVLVYAWEHEMKPKESKVQFLNRFFEWDESGGAGDVECVCGEILKWRSPTGSMDVTRVK